MRRATVAAAAIFLVLSVGCRDGSKDQSSVAIDTADIPKLFEQDVRRSFEASFHVAYDLEIEADGETHNCTMSWWKEGTERQRFDICAPLIYGDDFDAEPWRVHMFGDRDQILVCSSQLSPDPTAEELDADGGGACYEDPTGWGDLAGNAILYLEFPLEYPDALPEGYFDDIGEIVFESATNEVVAGRQARCYVTSVNDLKPGEVEESAQRVESRTCFAEDDGAILAKSGDAFFKYNLEATESGPVQDQDLSTPFPYVDADLN